MRPSSQTLECVILIGLKFRQQQQKNSGNRAVPQSPRKTRGFLAETPWAPGIVPHPPANPPTHTHTLSLSCFLIFVLLIGRSDSVVMVARATLPCPQPSLGRSLVTTGLAAASPGSGRTMVVAQAEQCQEGGTRHTACQEAWWAEPCRLAGSVAFLPQVRGSPGLGGC